MFPQLFWFKKLRTTLGVMFVVSILINVGMWFERFVILLTLTRDFLPSSWGWYWPTIWDGMTMVGSFGLFFTLFLLFLRFLPMISMTEVKNVLPQADPHYHVGDDHGTEKSLKAHPKPGIEPGAAMGGAGL